MLQFKVDAKLCTRCDQCVRDCIAGIIRRKGDAIPSIAADQEDECLQCQHCLAICPPGAISILGRDPRKSLAVLPGNRAQLKMMTRRVRGRRSFRHYRDENANPALIRDLLATLANVPTGVNRRELTFTVIDDKAVMQRFRERILKALIGLPAGHAYYAMLFGLPRMKFARTVQRDDAAKIRRVAI